MLRLNRVAIERPLEKVLVVHIRGRMRTQPSTESKDELEPGELTQSGELETGGLTQSGKLEIGELSESENELKTGTLTESKEEL